MRFVAAILVIFTFCIFAADLASAEVTVNLQVAAEGLTAPLNLVSPPDGTKRRFITEQIGVIKILMPDGKILDEPFLNIRHRIVNLMPDFDERGLLGLAFHPDFKSNGRFFVAYSGYLPGDSTLDKVVWYNHTNYVAEYRVSKTDPNKADPLSERILTKIDWPQFNHNGHWIGFGPDGFLYMSPATAAMRTTGGSAITSRRGTARISCRSRARSSESTSNGAEPYGIPADNPFVSRQDARPEIWAYGFRNPWRCSFDMGGTKELFCADVGQNSFEEVDIVTKGGNYGWRVKEGKHCFDYVNPNTHLPSCESGGDDRSDHRVQQLQRHPGLQGPLHHRRARLPRGATAPGRASTSSGTGASSSASGMAASTSGPTPAVRGRWRT